MTTSKMAHDMERRGRILTKKSPAIGRSIADALVIKDGCVFLVTEQDGGIPESGPHGFGLYYHDCRFLDGYVVQLDGRAPIALVATTAEGYHAILELTNPDLPRADGGTLEKHEIAVCWNRYLEGDPPALHDVLRVRNFGDTPAELVLSLSFQSSFEDLFAVRGLLANHRGTLHPAHWNGDGLRLSYDGADGVRRAAGIRFWRRPDETEGRVARFCLSLASEAEEEIALSVFLEETSGEARPSPPARPDLARITRAGQHAAAEHRAGLTAVETDHVPLGRALGRSIGDLAMLRSALAEETYYAAGVPWFVALFGRDALTVALEALAYDPGIARDTLRLLARHQAVKDDPSRDAEPGKILHELRVGELAHLGAIPQTPYYGAVDTTPLFLILLGRHAAWTGRLDLFRELRPNVDAALDWITRYGQAEMSPFVAYRSRATDGLANQGWKDSGDAVVMEDGQLGKQPIALCEVQGYVHLAWTLTAGLLDRAGEPERAADLRRRAAALEARFASDFWLAEEGFLALALTAGGPAKVLSSNAGQALWTGIVRPEEARRTAVSLLADAMWSGWGIRTLSCEARRYNPVSYHRGTVWPHDNAIILAGLRRHGLDAEACQVFEGMLDATTHFPLHRLPELFSGFRRSDYGVPVRYPVACHPQAWAAGALPFMLEQLLGLTPEAFDGRLRVARPALPAGVGQVTLRGLRVGDAEVDLRFSRGARGEVVTDVVRQDGKVSVVVE